MYQLLQLKEIEESDEESEPVFGDEINITPILADSPEEEADSEEEIDEDLDELDLEEDFAFDPIAEELIKGDEE